MICGVGILRGLVAAAPPKLPRLDTVRLKGASVAVALGLAGVAVLCFGLLPSLTMVGLHGSGVAPGRCPLGQRDQAETTRAAVARRLAGGARARVAGRRRAAHAQLAASRRTAIGIYDATFVDRFGRVRPNRYDSTDKQIQLGEQLEQRMRAIPGVSAVTPVLMAPFLGANVWHPPFEAEGEPVTGSRRTIPTCPWRSPARSTSAPSGSRSSAAEVSSTPIVRGERRSWWSANRSHDDSGPDKTRSASASGSRRTRHPGQRDCDNPGSRVAVGRRRGPGHALSSPT